MIWFLFKMIYRLATIAVFALVIYFVYATVTGQKIDAAELSKETQGYVFEEAPKGFLRVFFRDSRQPYIPTISDATVKVAKGMCGETDLPEKNKALQYGNYARVFNSECKDLNSKKIEASPYISFMISRYESESLCQDAEPIDLNGYGNTCMVEINDAKNGHFIHLNHPLSKEIYLSISADINLWNSKKSEILDMIKTTKYVGVTQ